jgi:hypothetical protein
MSNHNNGSEPPVPENTAELKPIAPAVQAAEVAAAKAAEAEASKPAAAEPAAPKRTRKPKLAEVADSNGTVAAGEAPKSNGNGHENGNGASPLVKPDAPFSLHRFKSKRDKTLANVEVDPGPLPVTKITDVKDFVRVHHDEENWWTEELCLISVPIKGLRKEQLHIIDEELAADKLEEAQIIRMRLALASKPYGKLFLAVVPADRGL